MSAHQSLPAEIVTLIESDAGMLLREDIWSWARWYHHHKGFNPDREPVVKDQIAQNLDRLFFTFREFRTLFDYRISALEPKFRSIFPNRPRATDLYIYTREIGPRFRILHGHSTYLLARSVGADFTIFQNVTVGTARNGLPVIGNGVTIKTGAVVVGPITIGDRVDITANAVVSVDVADDHIAYAPKTIIRPKAAR